MVLCRSSAVCGTLAIFALLAVTRPTRAETPWNFTPGPMASVRAGAALPWGNITGAGGYDDPMRWIVGPGMLFEADVGYRIDGSWTLYGFWEHGKLTRGERTQASPRAPTSNTYGFGFQFNTAPWGPVALIVDGASGIVATDTVVPETSYTVGTRWRDSNSKGWMPFRGGVGLSVSPWGPFRLDVLATCSLSIPYAGNCPDGCGNMFGYFGLTAGVRVGK